MPTYEDAYNRMAVHYTAFINRSGRDYGRMEQELPHLRPLCEWLSGRMDARFLAFVQGLAPSLRALAQSTQLLDYCQRGLLLAERFDINPGWLYLLQYEADLELGIWQLAWADVQKAVAASAQHDPRVHAHATLALGRLQINRGDYRSALRTLKTAEELLASISDMEGIASAKAEVAAYWLAQGNYQQALDRYLEVNEIRRQLPPSESSLHTLLMLGVVYRRLGNHTLAREYLERLLFEANAQKGRTTFATALHHLAWIHCDQRDLTDAKRLALQARQIYTEIGNPRGESDVDEQLGLIAFYEGDSKTASIYLEQALATRMRLGNQPGAASTLSRLAKLYLRAGHLIRGLGYLLRALVLYNRIHVLSRQRLARMLKSPFNRSLQ